MKKKFTHLIIWLFTLISYGQSSNIQVGNLENKKTVELIGDAGFQNGLINLFGPGGTRGIMLNGSEGPTNTGEIHIYNDQQKKVVELDAANARGNSFIELRDRDGNLGVALQSEHSTTSGSSMTLMNSENTTGILLRSEEGGGNGATIKLFNIQGQQTIEIDAENGGGGKGRIFTQELQITGGSDIAEFKNVESYLKDINPIPGMLVSVDESLNNIGGMKLSTESYDKKVAGIISGANELDTGMTLGQKGTLAIGEYPVAIGGQVYGFADTSKFGIKAGDLLTSSKKPGFVMKAKNKRKSHGAIVGKALTSLEKGQDGMVLILISLH